MGLDRRVQPMVKFFNHIGLKTYMSCSGHIKLDGRKALFWIEFDSSIIEEDLVKLWNKGYYPNGWFVQRLIPGPKYNMHRWCYIAGNWWSANQDLKNWKKIIKI